jgi:hypothetical protein
MICLLDTGNPSGTIECDIPSGNPSGCMSCNYTSANRVRPLGAEIEQDIELATSFSNSNLLTNPSQTAGGHFITRFLTSTGPADVPDTGPNLACGSSSWTALLTQSMSILGGGYGSKNFSESIDSNLSVLNSTDLLNNDQSFESYHTPPSSPCAGVSDEVSEVFVTVHLRQVQVW